VEPSGGNRDIEAELAEAQEFLRGLESGNLHIGQPFEGRTEAKIADLKRQIATYEAILEKQGATSSRS